MCRLKNNEDLNCIMEISLYRNLKCYDGAGSFNNGVGYLMMEQLHHKNQIGRSLALCWGGWMNQWSCCTGKCMVSLYNYAWFQ